MYPDKDRNVLIALGVTVLLALVFTVDFFTRRGLAEWIFYILPVGLCLFQRSALAPVLVAAVASVLVVVGFVLSPLGMGQELSAINRSIGLVTIWVVAFTVRQTLLTRAGVLQLSCLNEGRGRVANSALGDLKPEDTGQAVLAALAVYAQAHVGQVARSKKPVLMRELPGDYLKVVTASGSALPQSVIVAPITVDDAPYGVIELGFMRKLSDAEDVLELLDRIAGDLGIVVRTAIYRQRVLELLEETQRQGEELQAQQEELKVNNEELQEQSTALRESEVHLVSCRNVLIYFDRPLQDRAVGLFRDALVRRGYLGLGSKESLRLTSLAAAFAELPGGQRIYRKL